MDATVAICTWNRAAILNQTLKQMRCLEIPPGLEWELLIVNNNCTDDTDAVIARHRDALPLRRLSEPKQGHTNARNCAVGAARGDLVLWTDDDVLVHTGWMAALVDAASRYPNAHGFGGPIDPWFPVAPDPDYLTAFAALRNGFCGIDYDCPEGILASDRGVFGANMAFRRQVHDDHPFDSSLGMKPSGLDPGSSSAALPVGGGDECDLLRRIRARGGEVVWVPKMRVKHYVDPGRMTLNYLRPFLVDRGELFVRLKGVPPGKRVLGVPRWLLREWIEVTVAYWYNRLQRNRREALANKNRQWQLIGMIKGCLAGNAQDDGSAVQQKNKACVVRA
jgi:glucosyl-dolichyl phosphate glucuronosyltransferase